MTGLALNYVWGEGKGHSADESRFLSGALGGVGGSVKVGYRKWEVEPTGGLETLAEQRTEDAAWTRGQEQGVQDLLEAALQKTTQLHCLLKVFSMAAYSLASRRCACVCMHVVLGIQSRAHSITESEFLLTPFCESSLPTLLVLRECRGQCVQTLGNSQEHVPLQPSPLPLGHTLKASLHWRHTE